MPYIFYRKSEKKYLCSSGTIYEGYTGEDEICTNIIPNFGGCLDDYGFVEISDIEERKRIGKEIKFKLDDEGIPIGIDFTE